MRAVAKRWVKRVVLALAGFVTLAAACAWADGTLGLDEVLTAVAKAPKAITGNISAAAAPRPINARSVGAPSRSRPTGFISTRAESWWAISKVMWNERRASGKTIFAGAGHHEPECAAIHFVAPPGFAGTMITKEMFDMSKSHGPLRIGIGGPVGSGKTALMDLLCKAMRERYDIAAITNDIYTKWDAEFLVRSGSLTPDRIAGVETGGCPHTAIREDASMNLAAVADMRAKFPDLDLVLIESGGDNLAATFSPELADLTIYVIDVAAGDKIPSKGGPGITRSDLLVINKIDLAPHVGASLEKMDTDARRMRGERPFVMTNLRKSEGLDRIVGFIEAKGGLGHQARAKVG